VPSPHINIACAGFFINTPGMIRLFLKMMIFPDDPLQGLKAAMDLLKNI